MVDSQLWVYPALADKHECQYLKCQVLLTTLKNIAIRRQRDILAVGVEMTAAERKTGKKTGKYDKTKILVLWELRQNTVLIYLYVLMYLQHF